MGDRDLQSFSFQVANARSFVHVDGSSRLIRYDYEVVITGFITGGLRPK